MNPLIALRRRLQRALFAPVLEQFAAAMSECAEQLARHTDAVKGIASASLELLDVVHEMNEMLQRVSVDEDSEGQAKRLIAGNLSQKSELPE